jgi:transcriptional regulator with XRE-family HTH domain|tara:strand:- start:173 stop:391 length:219 start_codon:yes stop_codon:yes gene_type:complete
LTTEYLNWSRVLRDLRKEAGMTQKDLADKARIPQRTVSEYENASKGRHLSIYRVEDLLRILGYEIDVFLRNR